MRKLFYVWHGIDLTRDLDLKMLIMIYVNMNEDVLTRAFNAALPVSLRRLVSEITCDTLFPPPTPLGQVVITIFSAM